MEYKNCDGNFCGEHSKLMYMIKFLFDDRKSYLENKIRKRENLMTWVKWTLTTLVSVGLLLVAFTNGR